MRGASSTPSEREQVAREHQRAAFSAPSAAAWAAWQALAAGDQLEDQQPLLRHGEVEPGRLPDHRAAAACRARASSASTASVPVPSRLLPLDQGEGRG